MKNIIGIILFIYAIFTFVGINEVIPQEDIGLIYLLLAWLMFFKREDIEK